MFGPQNLALCEVLGSNATKTSAGNILESLSNLFLRENCRLLQRLLNNANVLGIYGKLLVMHTKILFLAFCRSTRAPAPAPNVVLCSVRVLQRSLEFRKLPPLRLRQWHQSERISYSETLLCPPPFPKIKSMRILASMSSLCKCELEREDKILRSEGRGCLEEGCLGLPGVSQTFFLKWIFPRK